MKFILLLALFINLSGCQEKKETLKPIVSVKEKKKNSTPELIQAKTFAEKLSNAAISIIDPEVIYTPTYVGIKYPNGDVPKKTGVCTDVVIRTYRKLNIDLQKEVHEDMKSNFSKYPKTWGLKSTDKNIDHRRVPNLEVFFERKGEKLIVSQNPNDYKTGHLVTWMIGNKLPHIGIITHLKSKDGKRPMIVHNVGGGQVLQDCLFNYSIVGHFRYGK
ncbi:DUF1287 domain-containing protein [Flavobacterium jejuense]|uniref:DUF1287 domain-containing protein n=1 Tax=Flavobacterium jejuense TaxID=1544455 RepID=A0ABX0ISG8_9FLAO|nr:DUF1287 domain-containing protein [Flavobacterium jejuense]NHN26035.1 DUF1287 domain-containing protein [Flavobacterium jejuense]